MLLLATGLVLLPIFIVFLKHFVFGVQKLPPGPNTWVVLRNLSKFGKCPHVALTDLAKIYGPLMSLRLGGQMVIVASSSEIVKEIFKTHDRNFSGRYLPSVYYKVPQAINSSLAMSRECDDSWKFLHWMTQNFIFSTKSVESKAELRKAKVIEMVDYLRSKEGEVVKVDDVINATLVNIISNTLVSRNLFDIRGEDENDEKVKEFIQEIVEMVASLGLADLFPVLKMVDFWSYRKGIDMHRRLMFMWEFMVKERRARQNNSGKIMIHDFLDVLVENSLSNDQISLVLMEILMGGSETSTVTSIWLMMELMRHQDILHKLRNEVAEAFQGEELANESILSECAYLQACIKEILRFRVPGPFLLPHRSIEMCKVKNYVIPKDSMVVVNAWALAQDPNSWTNAIKFNPERFLDSNIGYQGTHFEFIPFGAGRRMCPGSNVAFANIQLMIASLVYYFDWSLPNGGDMSKIDDSYKFGTSLKNSKPLLLIPRAREPQAFSY